MNKAIILAAGEGTRMKSKKSKVMHTLLNKPMISYVLHACDILPEQQHLVIAGTNFETLKEFFGDRVQLIKQEIGEGIPYGTGYAVRLALDKVDDVDKVLIIASDMPLVRQQTIQELFDFHETTGSTATVLTAVTEDPTGYGRIVKDAAGNLLKIVEHKDCTEEELKIREFNSAIMVVNGKDLKRAIYQLSTDNAQGEMYLTDIFEILKEEKKSVRTYCIKDETEVYGINSKMQLEAVENILRKRTNEEYMKNGVIMENANNIFIEPGVQIGRDTVIRSGAKIIGKTTIGENCLITGDTTIVDSEIADEVIIKSSVIEQSVISKGVDIGPYSHLRPKSRLEEKVHIGNFVEVKNATLGEGTKAGHLAYVGDADIGKHVNIGCGAIFVNYDGKRKFRSTVEDDAFIGSNANIVSPVHVEKSGFIAAGSTVTEDVPEGNLTIARSRQTNIAGWVEKKHRKDEEECI